jgi:ceramide glucosyltransferase
MIRFRVLLPIVLAEPLLNTFILSLAAALVFYRSPVAWALVGAAALFSIFFTNTAALLTRGYGFKLWHLALVPFRDLLLFFIWLRGATMGEVTWRGNRMRVLAKTRLAAPAALARVKKLSKSR